MEDTQIEDGGHDGTLGILEDLGRGGQLGELEDGGQGGQHSILEDGDQSGQLGGHEDGGKGGQHGALAALSQGTQATLPEGTSVASGSPDPAQPQTPARSSSQDVTPAQPRRGPWSCCSCKRSFNGQNFIVVVKANTKKSQMK